MIIASENLPQSPDVLWGDLFVAVQTAAIFPDSKTFVDCTPKSAPEAITEEYLKQKDTPNFDLKAFVFAHFDLPKGYEAAFHSNTSQSAATHIHALWNVLTRKPDEDATHSTLLPLPHPYIVPGGRFGEVYYWDSYFTMLGLAQSERWDMIRNMVSNFAYLIDKIGHIPNGNRTYYISRSQPPFFSLMVELLAEHEGEAVLHEFLPQLEAEYAFWMQGKDALHEDFEAHRHVVRMADGAYLNRYWDDANTPRPESYHEDVELAHHASQHGANTDEMYRHLRAAAESGWDFSSRWLSDGKNLDTIHTTDLLPVDLNALLGHLENLLAQIYALKNAPSDYASKVAKRAEAMQLFFHNGFFYDYDFRAQHHTSVLSLAGVFPLFFGFASTEQAAQVAQKIEADFLQNGGVVTTLAHTGQQWDAPNGWAPLQWITIQALKQYNYQDLAHTISQRWLALNDRVFEATGKMMEKYNVMEVNTLAGGGEYPNQDGFGWTNGVYLGVYLGMTK